MAEKKSTTISSIDMSEDKSVFAESALKNKRTLKLLIDGLSGDNRRMRQYCASVIGMIAERDIERLKPYSAELADALHRPEAQTRWEILRVLTRMVEVDARAIDKALSGAEASLHDEDSGIARLEAFRLLAAYGATTEARSNKVWPYLDEAIQCYHGDPEFNAMLQATIEFLQGNSAKEVRKAAGARMKFDAENSKGTLKMLSGQIMTESRKRR